MLSFWETVTAKGKGKKKLGPIKAVRFRNVLVFRQIPRSLLAKFMGTCCYCRPVLTVLFWCSHANCPISSSTLELNLEEKKKLCLPSGVGGRELKLVRRLLFNFNFIFSKSLKKKSYSLPTPPHPPNLMQSLLFIMGKVFFGYDGNHFQSNSALYWSMTFADRIIFTIGKAG